MTRNQMLSEIQRLADLPETKDRIREIRRLIRLVNEAICRTCGKQYATEKSRADYTGYCSAKCLHAKAKELGYRKGGHRTEYDVLKSHGDVGSIYVVK